MARFGLTVLTVLMVPALASADWVKTGWQSNADGVYFKYTQNGVGPKWTNTGYFENDYYGGSVNDFSSPILLDVVSYCATIDETNAGNQFGVTRTTIANEFAGNSLLRRQLAYLLNFAETDLLPLVGNSFLAARSIIQAAVWALVVPPTITNFSLVDGNDSTHAWNAHLTTIITNATNHVGIDTNDDYWRSSDYPDAPNQDYINRIDGGGNGQDPEPVPLPASAYGMLTLLGACFVGRRILDHRLTR
jgi:hypothetical protein